MMMISIVVMSMLKVVDYTSVTMAGRLERCEEGWGLDCFSRNNELQNQ